MTKLNKAMKANRKMLKNDAFPNVQLFSFPDHGVTVGIERTGDTMGRFAVAIAADDEPRFRRKVGELVVLERFHMGQTLPVNVGPKGAMYGSDDHNLAATAEVLAYSVTGNN